MNKSVIINQVDNGFIVFMDRPVGYSTRVFTTWLELFTEMGTYFSYIPPSVLGGSGGGGTCNGSDSIRAAERPNWRPN